MQGHGHAEFAPTIVEAYRTLRQKGAIYVFADIEDMSNYDSRLRVELTAAFSPDRARIAALHVLLKSKLVAMGVSVANLALGGIVKTDNDRAKFKQALDGCLFENRVVGFSSDALDTLRPRVKSRPAVVSSLLSAPR